ncbi:DUF6660 family protein [Sphingobacterium thalpophilum]|uniref:DUF6660 family protein n=1 Tax=Sphingobacterium thalpophilum TaxID=259 RepID=UPI0038999F4D
MKWKATIFLVYIMALFLVPCSDANNSCESSVGVTKVTSHDHDQDKDDSCTPFCQCACCSVSVAFFNFELPEFGILTHIFTSKKVVIRDSSFISHYSGTIWQPPKFNV